MWVSRFYEINGPLHTLNFSESTYLPEWLKAGLHLLTNQLLDSESVEPLPNRLSYGEFRLPQVRCVLVAFALCVLAVTLWCSWPRPLVGYRTRITNVTASLSYGGAAPVAALG
jgi:hypothetical protein